MFDGLIICLASFFVNKSDHLCNIIINNFSRGETLFECCSCCTSMSKLESLVRVRHRKCAVMSPSSGRPDQVSHDNSLFMVLLRRRAAADSGEPRQGRGRSVSYLFAPCSHCSVQGAHLSGSLIRGLHPCSSCSAAHTRAAE